MDASINVHPPLPFPPIFSPSPHFLSHLVIPKQRRNVLFVPGQRVVEEGARRERERAGLGHERVDDLGVAVALVDGGVGRQKVEVALAVDVPHVDAGLEEGGGGRGWVCFFFCSFDRIDLFLSLLSSSLLLLTPLASTTGSGA